MYQRIVVGTDGSETSNAALARAVELAKLCGAALHVVHAFRSVSPGETAMALSSGSLTVDVEGLNKGIEERGAVVCAQAAAIAQAAGVEVETYAVAEEPSDALIDVAKSVDADLIVVGNRGMSSSKRFLLGNVPNKVSHHAPCSILIVDSRS